MTSPQAAVYIAGVGMTPTGKFLERDLKQLTAAAVNAALADAGLSVSDIQAAYFSNATQGALEAPDHDPRPDCIAHDGLRIHSDL